MPTLNAGSVTLNFKVNTAAGSSQCDQLIVGYNPNGNSTGKANFSNNGGTTTVAISAQSAGVGGQVMPPAAHSWQVILFGTETGDVTLSAPPGYSKKWNANSLEIDN